MFSEGKFQEMLPQGIVQVFAPQQFDHHTMTTNKRGNLRIFILYLTSWSYAGAKDSSIQDQVKFR